MRSSVFSAYHFHVFDADRKFEEWMREPLQLLTERLKKMQVKGCY